MAKKADIPKQVVDAAMSLAAERGWRQISMSDIASAANLPIETVLGTYRSKSRLLRGYRRQIDAAALGGGVERAEPVRDRLFDVLMRRFDAMKPHREGLRAVSRDFGRDPLASFGAASGLVCSMKLMLEAAAISSGGIAGLVRAKGLAAIYAAVFRVWLDDESEDMSKTMAALDRRLDRADRLVSNLCRRRSGGAASAPSTA